MNTHYQKVTAKKKESTFFHLYIFLFIMQSSIDKKNINIEAIIYGSTDPPVSTTIPSSLKGYDIKNFLTFSHSMKVPLDSCIIVKVAQNRRKTHFSFHIVEDDKDFSKFANRTHIQVIIFPKSIRLRIHCADGRVSTRDYSAKTQAQEIVKTVCRDFFKLTHDIAYALYGDRDNLLDPIPPTKSILEYNPFLTDVWLLRRFWIKADRTLKEESDIHFNYSHARSIVFSQDFEYRNYNWEEMVALSLTIEYGSYEKTKVLLRKEKKETRAQRKEEKKKEKRRKKKMGNSPAENLGIISPMDNASLEYTHFPKWMMDDKKLRKKKHEIVEKVKKYESTGIVELKSMFIKCCLKNQFFGALKFSIKCTAPESTSAPSDFILSFTETKLYLLDIDDQSEVFSIDLPLVRRWKPINLGKITLYYYKSTSAKILSEWEIQSPNAFYILDYFTSLVNFVKQQDIIEQKGKRVTTSKVGKTEAILKTNPTLIETIIDNPDFDQFSDEDDKGPIGLTGEVLKRFDPPNKQLPDFLDWKKLRSENEEMTMLEELKGIFTDEETPKIDLKPYSISQHDDIIESGCELLRSIILQESISPIADATSWIQNNLPENMLTQSVIGWQLQGPSENTNDTIGTISRCIMYVFKSELSPLDSFVALNFTRSILMHYARQQWKEFDFVDMAEQVDENLGDVLKPVFNITRRLIYPLSTLVLEVSSDLLPDAHSLLYINESIAMALMLCSVAIAYALCDAGIAKDLLLPILQNLSSVPTYDPISAYELSDALVPILNSISSNEATQKALLSQRHTSNVDINSILNCILELYQFTHYMTSPVAVFCISRSPRVLTPPELPSNIPEASHIYQIARESALALWNFSDGRCSAMAQELSLAATNFFFVFIESTKDLSLSNQISKVFKILLQCLERTNDVFIQNPNILDFLNVNDPVHSILLKLMDSAEDKRANLSLLALDSVSQKHRIAVLEDSGQRIIKELKNLPETCDETIIHQVSDSFRIFATMVLSLSKESQAVNKHRKDLIDFGNDLVNIMKEENIDLEERNLQIPGLINRLRGFVNLGKSFNEFSHVSLNTKRIDMLTIDTKAVIETNQNRTSSFYELPVSLTPPDISGVTDSLSKLSIQIKRFKYEYDTDISLY
ncbi:hypothetical protein TRFO_07972 [Tritrichomonas foetus]|uniref:Uncharacterized protein n=1 Tax=Tritrichomonas foetus TaxID=1144522 RepID=A0A1J4JSR6_9EUKA|nr:hypothetical protein TRFO_07972 [Tritrichomonas foetus]|eukprot:OHT00309.1 hypothetical protein TRFO_07972 [Tritrichomonas foetus]